MGHLGAISGSSWVCFDQFQGYDFSFFGATCGLLSPSWRHLETVLRLPRAILGHPGTILTCFWPCWRHFGLSRRADQRRQSSFGKIRTSSTREHHSMVASRPFLIQYWGCLVARQQQQEQTTTTTTTTTTAPPPRPPPTTTPPTHAEPTLPICTQSDTVRDFACVFWAFLPERRRKCCQTQ